MDEIVQQFLAFIQVAFDLGELLGRGFRVENFSWGAYGYLPKFCPLCTIGMMLYFAFGGCMFVS